MKPIIGIIPRGYSNLDQNGNVISNFICFQEKIRTNLIKAGGIPIGILPPQLVEYSQSIPSKLPLLTSLEKQMLIDQIKLCDGILFPGGSKRFECDMFILDYALKHDIPILGICLGMQTFTFVDEEGNYNLNVERIVGNFNHGNYNNNVFHEVTISKDSKLYQILGKSTFIVNSTHLMRINNSGTFTIYGYSSDGVPELIERHDKKFAIGVQWHPEGLVANDPDQAKLFEAFVEACKIK